KKCVVLDLDNTVWGGVIGDDGLAGIEIGELGRGHVFTDLQLWLKQLKDRGILLAVCSKNNEDTAKEPFLKHEEMVLRLSDFAIFVANWEDKASNIRYIQQTLNIGMDSLVFIDDNPFERNLVRSMIPEICVPELPNDPAQYLSFLQGCNLFETASYSSEDADRTGMYQAEAKRRESEAAFASMDDYLISLDMEGYAAPFDELHYPRIAQLTQRSNQFNLRTVRYTEEDIARIASDDKYVTLYYMLKDKFGDHGLVSVVIMERTTDEEFFIDTWLMSCRVLKRGMEEFIINRLVEEAVYKGAKRIKAEYIPTPKNKMVEHIYDEMGFDCIGEGLYSLDIDKFNKLKTYIIEVRQNGQR
ncbi:MAG: HAD-IIIC family phosphatase, partial [Lachnospiraceae bacterium]|nr:HAD-IIIC family phosphatase [Lachnospiraceae bacterium]